MTTMDDDGFTVLWRGNDRIQQIEVFRSLLLGVARTETMRADGYDGEDIDLIVGDVTKENTVS
jgi:hypothetical protein